MLLNEGLCLIHDALLPYLTAAFHLLLWSFDQVMIIIMIIK